MAEDINTTIAVLRRKGFRIGESYVQIGLGPAGARHLVVVNDVAMNYAQARALAASEATLEQIASRNSGPRRSA